MTTTSIILPPYTFALKDGVALTIDVMRNRFGGLTLFVEEQAGGNDGETIVQVDIGDREERALARSSVDYALSVTFEPNAFTKAERRAMELDAAQRVAKAVAGEPHVVVLGTVVHRVLAHDSESAVLAARKADDQPLTVPVTDVAPAELYEREQRAKGGAK